MLSDKTRKITEARYCSSNCSLTKHKDGKLTEAENEDNTKEERYLRNWRKRISKGNFTGKPCSGTNLPFIPPTGFQEPSGIYRWEPLQPQNFKDKVPPL